MVRLTAGSLYAAYSLAQEARQEDVDEWVSGTGVPLSQALPCAVQRSLVCRTVRKGWHPIVMWGCTPTEREDIRQVWFVAHEKAHLYAITIHRHYRAAIEEMQPEGVSLRAYSYWRNVKHHRWMETHGFVHQGVHASPLGIPYLSFLRTPE